jgi:glycosyltransferase involved in cell wall biosynthesis
MPSPVSVVIPCTPKAGFLAETLRSVAEQTHQDWEVVLVLDGECEENREAARTLPEDRVQVHVTPAPRSGPAVGRNIGLEAAKHDLVAFLDADDVCTPKRLERQVAGLSQRPGLALIGAWARKIDPFGQVVGVLRSAVGPDLARTMLLRNCFITSTVVLRKEVAVAVGGFDPRLVRLEDYDLWLRVMARADGDVLPEELVGYRVHPGQYSRGALIGPQTKLLRRSKQALAKRIGVSGLGVAARHAAWLGVQVAKRRW